MCGKKPKTIFTDQDAAMAKAISEVFPKSYHRLCLWHLFQNALKNVNHAFKRSNSFASELRSCIYDFQYEDDFLNAWESLLEKHNLHQNKWMQDFFNKKEKRALVYGRHTFSVGATTTQLSESFNGRLRLYMRPTFNVLDFFRNFDRLLEDMRYKEIESNYEMSQKMPSMNMNIMLLKDAGDVYTPAIFCLLRGEYEKSCNLILSSCTQNSQLYEYERWTKHARSGCVLDNRGQIIKEDPKLVVSNRFKDLCRTAVEISSKAAECEDASTFFSRKLMQVGIEVDNILNKRSSTPSTDLGDINCQTNDVGLDDTNIASNERYNVSQVVGIKKKDGVSQVKDRPKICVEKKYKRNKGTHKYSPVRQDFSPTMPIRVIQNVSMSHGREDPTTIGINTAQNGLFVNAVKGKSIQRKALNCVKILFLTQQL